MQPFPAEFRNCSGTTADRDPGSRHLSNNSGNGWFHLGLRVACLLLVASLASCAKLGSKAKPTPATSVGSMPPIVRSASHGGGTPVRPPGSGTVELTPEEDIVFTDPDNPEASLPELTTLLSSAPKRRGPWEQSETIAKRRATREGKPLLIWFTDSGRSPMCKALNEELFSNPAFEEWAVDKLIRLRVDANIQVDDPDLSLGDKESRLVDLKGYVARMKKQYKVLGHPMMVLLNPGGEVIGRYRGYKRGDADYTWGLIKQGEAASTHAYQAWRASMEAKGYREWTDRQDRKVFAKLVSYAQGTLILIEPDGTRSRTQEGKLSKEDREWIHEQKKLRGL
jgi:thioredoxin-related protein